MPRSPASTSPPPLSEFRPRLWEADASPDPRSLTLREAFEQYFRASIVTQGNLEGYMALLNHWERPLGDWPTNPPIGEIDGRRAQAFVDALELSAGTRAKYARELRAILRRLAPESDHNPDGEGVLDRVVRIKVPKVPRQEPRYVLDVEIDALYEAAGGVRGEKIRGVPTAHWLRAALVGFYDLGPRRLELFAERPADRSPQAGGWRWHNLSLSGPTGQPSLKFWSSKRKDFLPALPVSRVLLAHLERIRGDRHAIFPATTNADSISIPWSQMVLLAAQKVPSVADVTPHDLRHTCQTVWDLKHFPLGNWICGRCGQDVADRSYRGFGFRAFELVEELPRPKSFSTIWRDCPRETQLRLF